MAPDGSVDWLCVPSFDSPSVFGSLLDRGAGYFRFAPVRDQRADGAGAYDPGTNVLVTTWHTPSGWLEVRDALTMAPRTGPDETTPHTRPPADDDAEHLFVRTAVCLSGSVEVEIGLRAGLRLRPGAGDLDRRDGGRTHAPTPSAPGRRSGCTRDLALGVEGNSVVGRHVLQAGESGVLRPVVVERPGRARRTTPTRPAGSWRPRSSGDAGWAGPASPTTRCARSSSARR